jgi:hypothetical protein
MSVKVVHRSERWIGYRLNILGIRVSEIGCQLVAKSGERWVTLGPRHDLPLHVPQNTEELKAAAADTLRLTAYQYMNEHKESDLADLLAQRKDFEAAMQQAECVANA